MSIFNDSKYTKWYYNIIQNAQNRTQLDENLYYEMHHIIPKSLGGINENNLVLLTGKEHFICHWLLTKMTSGKNKTKMNYAFCFMRMPKKTEKTCYKIPGYLYEKMRIKFSKLNSNTHKGKVVSKETRSKISKAHTGKESPFKGQTGRYSKETLKQMSTSAKNREPFSQETVEKIIESRSWYKHSEETKKRISESNKGKTFSHSEETKKRISEMQKGKPKNQKRSTCIHCGITTTGTNIKRWHNDNCKHKL